jgi:sugar phosphate isomerase/epimerase
VKFALSTNWSNGRLDDGAAIADEAEALGFDSLELGFRTQPEQLQGFRSRLDRMPVASVHAYCPVPIGAPSGHPELYQLCSDDANERALARMLLEKTFACAADLGAKVVVFHAGYADLSTLFGNLFTTARKLRVKRGRKLLDSFMREFEGLVPSLERKGVTLALENLPRQEGFPSLDEAKELMRKFEGAPLRLWFDTGHALVRETHGWAGESAHMAAELLPWICGMHLNDVKGRHDDHQEPGWGNVDFARLTFLAKRDILRVFEPHEPVPAEDLRNALTYMRRMWGGGTQGGDGGSR